MNRIKELRKKRRITQIRLSIAAEVSQETISAYENGKAEPKMDKLIRIADFLNTTTDYLLGRTDNDAPLNEVTNNIVDEQLKKASEKEQFKNKAFYVFIWPFNDYFIINIIYFFSSFYRSNYEH